MVKSLGVELMTFFELKRKLMPTPFFPDTLLGWVTLIAAPIAAGWALINFQRSNRNKAAEILLAIEKEYTVHIPILLKIENLTDYRKQFVRALKISTYDTQGPYSSDESKSIDELEAALRHFFVCSNVRRFGIDGGAIDRLCAWYLRVLVTDVDENGVYLRPELRKYVSLYWPQLYFWAPIASSPGFKRPWIYANQFIERFNNWRKAEWASPPADKRRVELRAPTPPDKSNNPIDRSNRQTAS